MRGVLSSFRLRAIALLMTIVMLTPVSLAPAGPVAATGRLETEEDSDNMPVVWILDDSSNTDILSSAWQIQRPLLRHGLEARSVSLTSIEQLEYMLSTEHPDIAVYLFASSLHGLVVSTQDVSWQQMAVLVNNVPDLHHIFGIGNAEELLKYAAASQFLHVDSGDTIDLRISVLYSLWTITEILSSSTSPGQAKTGEKLRLWVLRDLADNINEIISRGLIPERYTGERVRVPIEEPALTQAYVAEEPQFNDNGDELKPIMRLSELAQTEDYIPLREMSLSSGVGGAIGWVLDVLLETLIGQGFRNLELHVDAADEINTHVSRMVNETRDELVTWFAERNITIVDYDFSPVTTLLPRDTFEFLSLSDSLMLDAYYEADWWLRNFVEQIIETPVQTRLKGLVPVFLFRLGTPLNLGSDFASFGAVLRVKLLPSFELDKTAFRSFMNDAVLGGLELGSSGDTATAFLEVRRFIDVIPVMDIDFAICAFLPSQSDWVQGVLSAFTIDFFGSAHFQIAFPPIDASNTERAFIEVREWGFHFELDASYTITLIDFLAPGASGAISTILDWVGGLLDLSLTLTFSLTFEISQKFQGQGVPALSTLILEIIVGVTLNIRFLIAVFRGTFEVGMRFEQRSGILASPMVAALAQEPDASAFLPAETATNSVGVYLTLFCSLYLGIDLWFVSFGSNLGGPWTTTITIAAAEGTTDYGTESADLTDTDHDGLPDEFETRLAALYGSTTAALADGPYLDPLSADTDSDGLNDKLELELNTAPNMADTDGDLLGDGQEHNVYFTNPLLADTEFDGLTDYQECIAYGTSPFAIDTDGDGLTDIYEITTTYDISHTQGTFGAVSGVMIGGVPSDDRTDPLNPDTDNDGIFDGQEWENGVEYANESLLESSDLVFLQWTHPLDADTDDDSMLWFTNGTHFYPSNSFLRDMDDGIEVFGQYITFIDTEGYPVVELVKTNPVHPDTDEDSAAFLLNTDGYELSLTPPTNPTNGDTDHDGLKDGLEKIGPLTTGTDATNPDTDNDNLPDFEDVLLSTNPRDPDTDDDTVLDGDEYYIYGTDPMLNDTDLDGLTDGEELFFFYSNPTQRDSDEDGLTDGEEVLMFLTDPLLKDSDADGLWDGHEVFYSHTEPRLFDTDEDLLGDGDELLVYNSNPLAWDSDDDSLDYPNENATMTFPLSDGQEVLVYGTSPIRIDTDSDGLLDSQELYLAAGSPVFGPIPLSPLDNDTDDDTLLDGDELIVVNVTLITYPYRGLTMALRYGSSPVLNDTDNDMLRDDAELVNLTDPALGDTDADRLSDYVELYVTFTSPLTNDTDGDELLDWMETYNTTTPAELAFMGLSSFVVSQETVFYFPTSATDSDSDDDLLPDGLEYYYNTDPLDSDDNGNGVLDGYEFDTDNDGLSDGEEFYIYQTYMAPLPIVNGTWTGAPGGFDNPDSDLDGVSDGVEVLTYGSDPTSSDSDGDGISDGDELAIGGNPIVPISSGWPSWVLLAAGIVGGLAGGLFLETTALLLMRRRSSDPGSPERHPTKNSELSTDTEPETKANTRSTTRRSSSRTSKEGGKE